MEHLNHTTFLFRQYVNFYFIVVWVFGVKRVFSMDKKKNSIYSLTAEVSSEWAQYLWLRAVGFFQLQKSEAICSAAKGQEKWVSSIKSWKRVQLESKHTVMCSFYEEIRLCVLNCFSSFEDPVQRREADKMVEKGMRNYM